MVAQVDRLSLSTQLLHGGARIGLRGALDYRTASRLKVAFQRLERRTAPKLVEIDMAEVTHLDASGLGLLVGMARRQRDREGDLRLVNVAPDAMKALEITGLDRALHSRPDTT